MYAVEAFSTTALSIMDREPFPHHPRLTTADPFYQHPYGGVGRDIWTTKAGFARFFELHPEAVDMLDINVKAIDLFERDGIECLGYVIQSPNGLKNYKITIVDRSWEGMERHAARIW